MTIKKRRLVLISIILCLAVVAGILVFAAEKEKTEIYKGDFVKNNTKIINYVLKGKISI